MTNTGGFNPVAAAAPVADAVLRGLLDVPADIVRTDVPERPWTWNQLCGRYSLGPAPLTDPQPRMFGSAEVIARRDGLALRGRIPLPAVRRGLRLHPEPDDPSAFRVNLPGFGSGTCLVVFSQDHDGRATAFHLGIQPMTFVRR